MPVLLALSRLIDAISSGVGRIAYHLVLPMILISAGNALVRYTFNYSSNGLLEIQWYLFAAIFLLSSASALRNNEHVRIDLLSSQLPHRVRALLEIITLFAFLIPLTAIVLYYGWPYFQRSWQISERSSDVGGLIRWPVKLLIPAGFGLLLAQGLSEIIKKIVFLTGHVDDPYTADEGPPVKALVSSET